MTNEELEAKVASLSDDVRVLKVHMEYIKEDNASRKRTVFAITMAFVGAVAVAMVGWFASGGTNVK